MGKTKSREREGSKLIGQEQAWENRRKRGHRVPDKFKESVRWPKRNTE